MAQSLFKRILSNPLVKLLGFFAIALFLLMMWRNYDQRSDWATEYEQRASQLRSAAVGDHLTPKQAKEYTAAAELHEAAAKKIREWAWQPWRPLPDKGVLSPLETQEIIDRHE